MQPQTWHVWFYWSPSHCGIYAKDLVDQLIQEALNDDISLHMEFIIPI